MKLEFNNPKEDNWEIHSKEIKKRKPRLILPEPVDREISIRDDQVLLSITDIKGVIEYCNEDFVEISGYEEYDLVGSAHNIVRHPDMPRVVFKLMWKRIQNKQNIIAVVKNLAKTGRYYWVITDFVIKEDEQGNIIGYKAYRKPAPRKAIEAVIPIYKKLINIESVNSMDAAEKFLEGFFETKNTTYDDFIENLIIDNLNEKIVLEKVDQKPVTKSERKSFFKRLFGY
jgi:PAS domain S-box-containing protein